MRNSQYIAEYIEEMDRVGAIDEWTVVLMNIKNGESFDIGNLMNVGGGISRSEGSITVHDSTVSIKAMLSKGHDYLDFTQKELDDIEDRIKELKQKDNDNVISEKIRAEFRLDKALLLIYPIADAGALTEQKGTHKTPVGIGVVFPNRQGKGKLRDVTINEIAYREEEEEDFYDYDTGDV